MVVVVVAVITTTMMLLGSGNGGGHARVKVVMEHMVLFCFILFYFCALNVVTRDNYLHII